MFCLIIVFYPIVPHFLVFLTLLVGLVVPANPEKVVELKDQYNFFCVTRS